MAHRRRQLQRNQRAELRLHRHAEHVRVPRFAVQHVEQRVEGDKQRRDEEHPREGRPHQPAHADVAVELRGKERIARVGGRLPDAAGRLLRPDALLQLLLRLCRRAGTPRSGALRLRGGAAVGGRRRRRAEPDRGRWRRPKSACARRVAAEALARRRRRAEQRRPARAQQTTLARRRAAQAKTPGAAAVNLPRPAARRLHHAAASSAHRRRRGPAAGVHAAAAAPAVAHVAAAEGHVAEAARAPILRRGVGERKGAAGVGTGQHGQRAARD